MRSVLTALLLLLCAPVCVAADPLANLDLVIERMHAEGDPAQRLELAAALPDLAHTVAATGYRDAILVAVGKLATLVDDTALESEWPVVALAEFGSDARLALPRIQSLLDLYAQDGEIAIDQDRARTACLALRRIMESEAYDRLKACARMPY